MSLVLDPAAQDLLFREARTANTFTDEPVTDVWDWRAALDPKEQLANLSSFGEDAAGELYLLSIDGDVYRFDAK